MRGIALLLAYFVGTTHGRRLFDDVTHTEGDLSSRGQLSALLLAMNAPSMSIPSKVGQSRIANHGLPKSQLMLSPRNQLLSRTVVPKMFTITPAIAQNAVLVVVGLFGILSGYKIGEFFMFVPALAAEGKTEEDEDPCFDCTGRGITDCLFCEGTGKSPRAAARAKLGKEIERSAEEIEKLRAAAPVKERKVTVIEEWDGTMTEVVEDAVLDDYPIKEFDDPCLKCEGRGVRICTTCDGSGFQPQFMDKFSPEDFMD